MEQLIQIFREHKLKVTSQRLAIYNMLLHTNIHPSAEKIHSSLKSTYPCMSLATVYKTLDTFKQVGLIQELNTGEGSFRYDSNTINHAHITCRVCNEIFDVCALDLDSILGVEHDGFLVDRIQLLIYGVCQSCK